MTSPTSQLQVQHININQLKTSEFNPRTWSDQQLAKLRESIEMFGVVDPLIVNSHPSRKNIVIGGNMRLQVLQEDPKGKDDREAAKTLVAKCDEYVKDATAAGAAQRYRVEAGPLRQWAALARGERLAVQAFVSDAALGLLSDRGDVDNVIDLTRQLADGMRARRTP
jgi:hypothetical protein